MVIYVYDFDHLPLYMIKVHVLILPPMHRYLQAKEPYIPMTVKIMPRKFIHLLPWRTCISPLFLRPLLIKIHIIAGTDAMTTNIWLENAGKLKILGCFNRRLLFRKES